MHYPMWKHLLNSSCGDEEGSSALEYAILLALIASTLLPFVKVLGDRINNVGSIISGGLLGDSSGTSPSEPGPAPEEPTYQ
jgi:Flp pilus assembly pilin Flp